MKPTRKVFLIQRIGREDNKNSNLRESESNLA